MNDKVILELVDAALRGDRSISQMAVRKLASKIRVSNSSLYEQISQRLNQDAARSSLSQTKPLPVDTDSRQSLIRVEEPTPTSINPTLSESVQGALNQVLLERTYVDSLLSEGLYPTKSIIFQGPPGVGKTMSARWLAQQLDLPLLVLDLATVMSSFLGKTGSNIRAVLDHAMAVPCVLLLDEFDAIAKRRDDDRELGELKRLVTVLLQAIDDWPSTSLLVAATNHGELLDPAIWRRFDLEVSFDMPSGKLINSYVKEYWPDVTPNKKPWSDVFKGMSFSDIDRELTREKRAKIISSVALRGLVGKQKINYYEELSLSEKKSMAVTLHRQGLSQRAISEKLRISRPTVKKALENAMKD